MDVWGLTGMMGSGKSFALELLAKMGIPCLDADKESSQIWDSLNSAKDLTAEDLESFLFELKTHFDEAVDLNLKKVSKEKILKVVSGDDSKRKKLESIMIPRIGRLIREKIKKLQGQGHKVCFVEGTRLAESTLRKDVLKGIVFVEATEKVRIDRIKKRNPSNYLSLVELQKSQNEKTMREVSSVVWKNNSASDNLLGQIEQFMKTQGYSL